MRYTAIFDMSTNGVEGRAPPVLEDSSSVQNISGTKTRPLLVERMLSAGQGNGLFAVFLDLKTPTAHWRNPKLPQFLSAEAKKW